MDGTSSRFEYQQAYKLIEIPQRGWTETMNASEIDLPTIWAKVEELSRII